MALSNTETSMCRSRRDCGNLEAVYRLDKIARKILAAVAATAAILRRNLSVSEGDERNGRSRRDCGNLEAVVVSSI